MRAAVRDRAGEPAVLRVMDLPDPAPRNGEVLIAVRAIALEGGDLMSRRLAPPLSPDHVIGYQAAGEVLAVGAGVTGFAVGDRVATFAPDGSHATLRVVPATTAWRLPDALGYDVGATVPVTFGTADEGLFEVGRLAAGETVLVHGASGGVGIAAVQLAARAGATVIATAHRPDARERLIGFGAQHALDSRADDLAGAVRALTGGTGVDLVLDMAGGRGIDALVRAVRQRGRIVLVGAASGEFAAVDLMTLVQLEVSLHGFMYGRHIADERESAVIERHLAAVAQGELVMPIHASFELDEIAAAHAMAEEGHPFGRIIIRA